MWKAYSAGYIRNNKTGNRFIMTISFLASALLSLVSSLFYNLWADQVQKAASETGTSRVEMTPAIIAYIVVFSVASIALIMMIHHAFAATMTNRIHQLGILKSVGATRRQIRKALTNEVLVLSLPAIVIGNIVGIGLAWLFMTFIITSTASLRDYTLTFAYHPIVFFGSFLFSVLTALISAWIPAKKISRITPLDAIRYGNEPVIKRVKKYRVHSAVFGIYGELAYKSLYARRKAMRIGTMSILLAVFACVSLLNMFGISNLSTEKTYFDRFKDNWDFLVISEESTYGKELLDDIRNIDGVSSCIVHKKATGNTQILEKYLSIDVQKLGLENLNNRFMANDNGTYNVNAPIYILDDNSFERYRGEKTDANVIAVNIIWDSIHSERTNRQYVPFLNDDKEILLDLEGIIIPVIGFANELPVLRESLEQYALSLVMSESYYDSLGFNLEANEYFYTIKVEDGDRYDVVKEELQELLLVYPDYAFEGRIEERENELEIQKGLRMIIYAFTGLLTCIGLANIFASTLGQIHQRKREFARYYAVGMPPKGAAKILTWEAAIVALRPIFFTIVINIPLMAVMLNAGGITAQEFIAKRLPLIPAITLFVAVIGFVGLAYYLGGRKICNMNLVDVIKDDTLSM